MNNKQANKSSHSTSAIVISSAMSGAILAAMSFPQYLLHSALGGTALGTVTATVMNERRRKHLKGREVVEDKFPSIKKCLPSHALTMAGIPFNESKSLNSLVLGRTGAGKTQAIMEFLNSARNRPDIRVVVLDRGAEYLQSLYRQDRDQVFNPSDRRSIGWMHRQERFTPLNIAQALITMPKQTTDEIWYKTARVLLVEIWRTTRSNRETSQVLRSPLSVIRDRIAGTQAAQYFDDPKLATSVMFTLNAACHFYESLIDSEQQISFFEYGASDRPEWLFLPLLAGNEEIFKPLYSMAFDLIIQGILSRGDNNKMKTIIIIDELGALQELPSLNRLLSEGRKSGGSAIVGTQSLAQVVQVYGKEGAENFLQNTFTKFIFGCPNPNDSEQMARVIGKQDVWEESRSANYDWLGQQSTTRSWQSQEKDVVSPSEIQTLPDLEGYCVVADSMQVKKFRICPRDYGKLNTIFIPHPQSQVDPWQVDIGL